MSILTYKILAACMLTGTSFYFLTKKQEKDAIHEAKYKIIITPAVKDGDFPQKWKGPA